MRILWIILALLAGFYYGASFAIYTPLCVKTLLQCST
jgi:hypothetical protein